jgi:3-dehydroquinate synthetase
MNENYSTAWVINASKNVRYEIRYTADIFDINDLTLVGNSTSLRRLIIIDSFILHQYRKEIYDYFELNTKEFMIFPVEIKEENKNLEMALSIVECMEKFGLLRKSEPVIAIGGGSLLDTVGFACSIYRRGVPYIRVPTTLLSIVDVSVAIKTAINHFGRRNRLGAYCPPELVLLNRKFIATQSTRDIANGLGEILKIAIINDFGLFELLENYAYLLFSEKFQHGAIPVKIINKSIITMINNLQSNLWEEHLERAVDFGHSFSQLIEQNNLPELLHGEAVALDCLFSCCISVSRGLMTRAELDRVYMTTKNLNLPTFHKDFVEINTINDALADTVKHRNGNQNLPIPSGIGFFTFINDLTEKDISSAIDIYSNLGI